MERRIIHFAGLVLLCGWLATAGAQPESAIRTPAAPMRFQVFDEALVPFGKPGTAATRDLHHAISAYRKAANPLHTQALDRFLKRHPNSAWRISLLANEGLAFEHAGEFTRAIQRFQTAWDASRSIASGKQKALADQTLGELLYLHAAFGHQQAVKQLLGEIRHRALSGPAQVDKTLAQEGLWSMQHDPGDTFLCGLVALKALLAAESDSRGIQHLGKVQAGPHGINMERLHALAAKAGLPTRVIHRGAHSSIPVPSVVHWKVGHYAAIVGQSGGRFHIRDATLGHDLWMRREAVQEESSGYFLVASRDRVAQGWRVASRREARMIVGAGITPGNNPDDTSRDDPNVCGCGSKGSGASGSSGMAQYTVKAMLVSLSIHDTPVGYAPPLGPAVPVTIVYSQREANQPANFPFFNLSQKWTSNWLSYVTDDPTDSGHDVSIYLRGGGTRYYRGYTASTGKFSPEERTGAQLVEVSTSPIKYERQLTDGSKEIYSTPDGNSYYPRRVFLTRVVDPSGNSVDLSYDSRLRLTALTDALGQQTTFQYENTQYPLQITGITDPFGRQATIKYDGAGRLVQITDVMGMQSQFAYDDSTFIQSMTTPYGTTHFAAGQSGTERWLEITDPEGHKEKVEYRHNAPGIPFSTHPVPNGLSTFNRYINDRNTYFWDKTAMRRAPGDYSQAVIYHWLHERAAKHYGLTSGVLESIKRPLENRIWFDYPDQAWAAGTGGLDKPSAIARVLGDGSTQLTRLQYNRLGRVTQAIDPRGREVDYTYAANAIDLTSVTRKTASGSAVLTQFTYNDRHEPLTYTDAAGETTRYAYNDHGQLARETDALGHVTRYNYTDSGYLQSVIDANGKTRASYTYDSYGRVASRTDSEGHAVQYSYDALNRLTAITYPDGTQRAITWNRLDPASITDREGRTTSYDYDSVRDLISKTDPMDQVTRFGYYANGKLQSLTDPNGNTTTWTRDIEGRITTRTYADGSSENLAYDVAGRLQEKTDPLGQTTDYSYTLANRLAGIAYAHSLNPTPDVHFSYGTYYPRRTSMTDGHGTTAYSYYPAGVPGAGGLKASQGDNPHDSLGYTYDALGQLVGHTIDGAQEKYVHDVLGRLTEDTNPLSDFNTQYLGETSQPTRLAIANVPYQITYRYRNNYGDRRLKAIQSDATVHGFTKPVMDYGFKTSPESLILSRTAYSGFSMGYRWHHPEGWHDARPWSLLAWLDALLGHDHPQGNGSWGLSHDKERHRQGRHYFDGRNHRGFSNGVIRYSYDDALQLTGVHGFNGHDYTYDAAGNLVEVDTRRSRTRITVNDLNQIQTAGDNAFAYDADGHLVDDGTHTYKWDAADRLIEIDNKKTGHTSRFNYDGLSRRITDTETKAGGTPSTVHFLWCGQRICEKRDDSGSVLARYYAQGEIHNGTALFYARDQVGSIVALINRRGHVVGRLSYGAYGKMTHAYGILPDYRYAGLYYHPASGLELATYRAYAPGLKRWLSRDPLREAGGINLYAYVGDNPISYIDPNGQFLVAAAVGGGIGAIAGGFGAWATGGDWHDTALAAATGALTGGLIGLTNGASLLVTDSAIGGAAINAGFGAGDAGISNAIGQAYSMYRKPCTKFNYASLIGSTIGGAIGGPFGGMDKVGLSGITDTILGEFSSTVLAGKFELTGSAIGVSLSNENP